MLVRLVCRYPGTTLGHTDVTFVPAKELGATAEEVHSVLTRRAATMEYIDIPVEDGEPIPLWTDTLVRLEVRE